jgi:hypothetical protein
MARVYSAVMGGKASKVDANELKMNIGGRIDLERESKKGDHTSRDLNNYNDVLDLSADGMVGAETGLYNVGGGVKELVEYITISNYSETPYHDIDKIRFYNFLDFKNFIKEKYEKEGIKSHRLIYICVNNDDSFSELNINISKGNNTKNNFNPFTGSFNAFYKNIDGKIATSKFDWNFWGGVKTAKKTSSQTSNQIDLLNKKIWVKGNPDLSRRVQELGFANGFVNSAGKTPYSTKFGNIYFGTKGGENYMYILDYNKDDFDAEQEIEVFESDLFPTASAKTTSITGKFHPSEIEMFEKIDEILKDNALRYVNYSEWTQSNSTNDFSILNRLTGEYLKLRSFVGELGLQKEDSNKYKSEALLKDYNEWKETQPTIATTTSALPNIDLSGKKIWFGDNNDLKDKVLKLAYSQGFQANRTFDDSTKSFTFYDNNGKKKIYGWIFREAYDTEPETEIFESDLFGTASTTTTSALPNIDLSNTKIWIGDNPKLSERVQERAFELGWKWNSGARKPLFINSQSLKFWDDKSITYDDNDKDYFDRQSQTEIFESDLFPTETLSRTSSQNKTNDLNDLAKSLTADLDKLVFAEGDLENFPELLKEEKDLENLKKLLPSFQQKKYAIERAKILKEIKRLHKKLTYEGFIKGNEENSSDTDLFTPQGLLDYYYTQATQNPTADLEPPCELPTPNGEKSKLPLSAYLNVRTQQFKNWFGDWEKAYETGNYVDCSKMIDPDTKEPKIYYHGVRKYVPNFGQFSNMGQGIVRPYGSFEPPSFPASFFAGEEEYAKFYGGIAENMPTPSADYKPFIYKVFLSVKNPISLLPLDFMLSYKDFMDYIFVAYGVKVTPNQKLLEILDNDVTKKNPMWIYVRRDLGLIEMLKDFGYDALFQIGDIPTFLPNGEIEQDRTKHLQEIEYLTFYPNQVKSASVKKSFYFNFFNDIRFKKGGYVRI